MVRPQKHDLDEIFTHQNLLRFDAAKIQVFQEGKGVIGDVAMCTQKCKIYGQVWVLCPALRTEDEGQTKYFMRGRVGTELSMFKVTEREREVIDTVAHDGSKCNYQ